MVQHTSDVSWPVLLALTAAMSGCHAGRSSPETSMQPYQGMRMMLVDPSQRPSGSQYAAGELLLKFKSEAGARLDEALKANRSPRETGLAWLDALNRRYGVTKIEPVLRHRMDIEDIRHQYPQRARRAPPDATPPSLNDLYTLTLRKDANVLQAAADYSAHPDVEYAQPNYIVTIQQGPIQ